MPEPLLNAVLTVVVAGVVAWFVAPRAAPRVTALAAGLMAVAIATSACGLFLIEPSTLDRGFAVENETDERLDVFNLGTGVRDLGPVDAHGAVVLVGIPECTDGPLIARNNQGEEVARREESICYGETWVIEEK